MRLTGYIMENLRRGTTLEFWKEETPGSDPVYLMHRARPYCTLSFVCGTIGENLQPSPNPNPNPPLFREETISWCQVRAGWLADTAGIKANFSAPATRWLRSTRSC